jgi:hypothetical protein
MSNEAITDLTALTAPKSDQINADDLIGTDRTVTITGIYRGNAEQPIEIHLAECKPYRPGKSMARVLAACWGNNPAAWPKNARMTLYRDSDVMFGGVKVGGIRISHLSHIDRAMSVALTVTKGKKAMHTVQPLKPEPTRQPTTPPPTLAEVLAAAGATMAAADAWFTAKGKPAVSTVSPAKQTDAAGWLTNTDPGKAALAEIVALSTAPPTTEPAANPEQTGTEPGEEEF